jgi:hypothetical protein
LLITNRIFSRDGRLISVQRGDIVTPRSQEVFMVRPRLQKPLLAPSPKRKRLESREGTVITSLALPRRLHQRAMMASVRLTWTFAEVVRAALTEWLVPRAGDSSVGRGGRR